jgi:hypothetical protein
VTETQKRIKAYQDALPGLRERVAAVALLLVMSMAMMTSASFAWLTISRSPEVSGVSTNIAANKTETNRRFINYLLKVDAHFC